MARFVPAAGRTAFMRLYDPALALTMRERRFRALQLDRLCAALPQAATVVDIGCGTGTFAISLAAARRDAQVVGIDPDPQVLAIARAKPGAETVSWREGFAGELDVADGGADAVVMSLLLHHLDAATRRAALADARRALRPGGHLHVADWGRPQDPLMRTAFTALRLLDGFENTREHAAGRLADLIATAGFASVTTYARLRTAWGSLELLDAA